MNQFFTLIFVACFSCAGSFVFGQGSPPPKGVEIFVDLSKVPEGKWVTEVVLFPGDKPTGNEIPKTFFRPQETIECPEEWKKIKLFEDQDLLPVLKITKKQLEEEGKILPLDELVKETDVSKIDKKALRRSLLHYLMVEAGQDEVVVEPVNLNWDVVSLRPETFESNNKMWGEPKELVADILIIEYLQKRPEEYWKMGALNAADHIVSSVCISKFGDIKAKFPIGAAVIYLYMIPNMKYAVPQAYNTPVPELLDCLLSIASLYSIAEIYPQWYPNLWSNILDIEKRINPEHMNIHCEMFAIDYEEHGDLKSALATLKRYDPRANVKPTNDRIEKSIARLEKLLEGK
jgi:hypothetical protein